MFKKCQLNVRLCDHNTFWGYQFGEKYVCSKADHVVKMQTNNPQYSAYYLQLVTIDHESKFCSFIKRFVFKPYWQCVTCMVNMW